MKFLDSNVLAYAFYNNPYTEKCQRAINQGGFTNIGYLGQEWLDQGVTWIIGSLSKGEDL